VKFITEFLPSLGWTINHGIGVLWRRNRRITAKLKPLRGEAPHKPIGKKKKSPISGGKKR
jgi:hypothetical protein